jgi:hypothetical protein
MTFKTVTEFSSYDDASGAQMVMSHPFCGTIGFNFVCAEVRRNGLSPVKCFGNSARGKRDWAIKKMVAEFQAKVDDLGPEWLAKHKELYDVGA